MNTYEIKEKLNSQEYDFLRTDKHLGDNIILLTTGGSHSYGTNIDTPEHTSDLDIRGISIENLNEIIGLSNFEQFINEATDTTVYGLRKVLGLMLNCNPNVIEMLGTKDEHLFICNKYGQLLRDNVNLFLSKKAINSFPYLLQINKCSSFVPNISITLGLQFSIKLKTFLNPYTVVSVASLINCSKLDNPIISFKFSIAIPLISKSDVCSGVSILVP